ELGGAIAAEAEVSGDMADLLQVRWTQARVLASRGGADASEAAGLAEGFLVDAARESGGIEDIIGGLTASAMAFAAAGQPGRARDLLIEIDATANVRESPVYPAFLGDLVRTALAVDDRASAERFVEGVAPVFAYHGHALCAASAMLAEARGGHEAAAARHAEAAARWEAFGVVPERAHALLGLDRKSVV